METQNPAMIARPERFTMTVATYLVLFRGNQTLLLRRYNTGYADGMYSMIAGHLDGGETVRQATVREAMEEGRIRIDPDHVEIVHVMHRRGEEGGERIDYFCLAKRYEGEPRIGEPEKCDDMSWFDIDALPVNTLPYIKEALLHIRQKVPFSTYGF